MSQPVNPFIEPSIPSITKNPGYIKSSVLLLIAFASVFFPRLLDSAGFPAMINFVHFAIVPFCCAIVLVQARTRNRSQIAITQKLLLGLTLLLGAITLSAYANQAGVINSVLTFLMLGEPFIFLIGIVCVPMQAQSFHRFKFWITGFLCFHIALALLQKALLEVGIMRPTSLSIPWDNIQGVFYLSGSGHVVGASVSIAFGIYFLISSKNSPFWLRIFVLSAAFLQLLFADAKQVLMVSLIAWFLLIIINVKDIKNTVQYIILASLTVYALLWCMENVELFRAFNTWVKPELYGPDGEATILKLTSIRMILSYYTSDFNWLLGLGPGHTVGRLGGWMLPNYWGLLEPLGATMHPVSQQVWDVVWGSLLARSSSMFSPFFGWAGIWGDLGFLGLASYLYLAALVWRSLCHDAFSKFLMLNIFIHGLIFSQMEEPGYMLYMALLVGFRWHERQTAKMAQRYPAIESSPYPTGQLTSEL